MRAEQFHDFEGHRTFVWVVDRWVSIYDMVHGQFQPRRMCSFIVRSNKSSQGDVTRKLMVKNSKDGEWVLGIALDIGFGLSCNHQIWPSCIHSNPAWDKLTPGKQQTAHGKVYYFKGSREELLNRYISDFKAEK